MTKKLLIGGFFFIAISSLAMITVAEEGSGNFVDSVKKTYRKAKDDTCEVLNGKLECLGKHIVNEAANVSDKVKTETKEIKK